MKDRKARKRREGPSDPVYCAIEQAAKRGNKHAIKDLFQLVDKGYREAWNILGRLTTTEIRNA